MSIHLKNPSPETGPNNAKALGLTKKDRQETADQDVSPNEPPNREPGNEEGEE